MHAKCGTDVDANREYYVLGLHVRGYSEIINADG